MRGNGVRLEGRDAKGGGQKRGRAAAAENEGGGGGFERGLARAGERPTSRSGSESLDASSAMRE